VEKFAEILKELREDNKLSQQELADKTGISVRTISRWENKTKRPALETIIILSKFFNVSIDFLLGFTDTP